MNEHMSALQTQFDSALAEITSGAREARAAIDGEIEALQELEETNGRPPLIADVPVDEPPPYIPPQAVPSANALIPDTPLVDFGSSAAFDDDAPLWQN